MVEREEDYFYGFRIRYNFYERFYSYFICEFFCVFRVSNDITDNSALRSRTWWDGSIYRNYRRYFYIFSFIITALSGACFGVKMTRYHLFLWAWCICDISRNIWIFNNYVHVDYYAYGSRCWLGIFNNSSQYSGNRYNSAEASRGRTRLLRTFR